MLSKAPAYLIRQRKASRSAAFSHCLFATLHSTCPYYGRALLKVSLSCRIDGEVFAVSLANLVLRKG